MKKVRGKFRRSLAGFLAFCVTATSFNTVSWADVGNALDTQNVTFIMSGEDLKESAQAAVDEGNTLDFDDLGITSEENTSKEYKKLFEDGSVYEFMPSYDTDEDEIADGALLRMFIQVKDQKEGYQLTGNEKIIFLYMNDSEGTIKFRTDIDGYLTEKVSVKGNTFLLEKEITVPSGKGKEENQTPGKGAAEEETTAAEETPDVIPDTTIAPSETEENTESAVAPEEATEAPEETTDKTTDKTSDNTRMKCQLRMKVKRTQRYPLHQRKRLRAKSRILTMAQRLASLRKLPWKIRMQKQNRSPCPVTWCMY